MNENDAEITFIIYINIIKFAIIGVKMIHFNKLYKLYKND